MTQNIPAADRSAAKPRIKHDQDWHSADYVRDWRERDSSRTDERARWLARLIAALPFGRDEALRVLDVGGGYGVVSEQVL